MLGGWAVSMLFSLAPVAVIIVLFILIYKRIRDKENEDFEDRDY